MSAQAASKAVSSSRPFRILALPLVRLPRASTSSSPSSSSGATPTQSTLEPSPPSTPSPSAPHDAQPGSPGAWGKAKNPLMFYQVLQPPPSAESGPPSYSTRALNKASETWLKIGEKPKDSWMYWFYSKGESLMDRIEYEEWSLKAIHEGRGVKVANKEKGEVQERIEIPLLHPQFKDAPLPALVPKLHRMLIHRIPYHRKMMWRTIIFSPATWPFALIPVIPNFPLFYVLWRAWSHYKAWRGAQYLESLLKLGLIVERPSQELSEIYESTGVVTGKEGEENLAPDRTSTPSSSSAPSAASTASSSSPSPNAQGATKVPPQAAGKSAAPDGTTTPSEMIYPSSPSSSSSGSTPTSSSAPAQGSSPKLTSDKKAKAKPRHANLLLRPQQVPLLTKAFGLTKTEIIDINRAVEQANLRAIQASQAEATASQGPADQPPKGEQPGTSWRGNLHR